jgi:choline kinase
MLYGREKTPTRPSEDSGLECREVLDTIAIILVAGAGKRLRPLTEHIPKALLQIDDRTILEHAVANLSGLMPERVILVVGHARDKVLELVAKKMALYDFSFEAISNGQYASTNTGHSLELALERVGNSSDLLVINGDLVFDGRILTNLTKERNSAIVVDRERRLTDESFKVQIDHESIVSMGKDLPLDASTGEFIGLSLLSHLDIKDFRNILSALVRKNAMEYYDKAFVGLSRLKPIRIVWIDGLKWSEVDTREDLEEARKLAKLLHHGRVDIE